jgi:hypothetical protein
VIQYGVHFDPPEGDESRRKPGVRATRRGFESCSLQQRVMCEPDFRHASLANQMLGSESWPGLRDQASGLLTLGFRTPYWGDALMVALAEVGNGIAQFWWTRSLSLASPSFEPGESLIYIAAKTRTKQRVRVGSRTRTG